jgi:hypothetical protein
MTSPSMSRRRPHAGFLVSAETAFSPSSPSRTRVFRSPCRDRPRLRAARARLPPARTSAISTNRRSNCSRASARRPDDTVVARPMTGANKGGRTHPRGGAATTSDAMTFCSSRTLPGHCYRDRSASVAGESRAFEPARAVAAFQQCSARTGMSAGLSRSGGIWIRTTSSR